MALLAVLFGTSASPQPTPRAVFYPPTDEAVLEPELFATRAAVLMALQAKDWTGLQHWMRREPCETFGDPCNLVSRLEMSDTAAAWLTQLLSHGGTFERPGRSTFCAPYWKNDHDWLLGELPYDLRIDSEASFWIVVSPEAVMRSQPSADAPIIRRLTLEVLGMPMDNPPIHLTRHEEFDRYEWVGIGERRGFVDRSAVRWMGLNQQDSACFSRVNGTWRLSSVYGVPNL
jgi:hypothetical protein